MYKKLWRDVIAPRLTNRLAARVASLLVGDPAFAAQISRSLPYEPDNQMPPPSRFRAIPDTRQAIYTFSSGFGNRI